VVNKIWEAEDKKATAEDKKVTAEGEKGLAEGKNGDTMSSSALHCYSANDNLS
jgi:hypothetical protein